MLVLPQINENETDYSRFNQHELNNIFIAYCLFSELDKMKHMFNSINMKIYPNVHFDNDLPFKRLIDAKTSDFEVVDYLIFEKNIEMTQNIKNMLNVANNEYSEIVKNKFILRDINKLLNADLIDNKIKVKKVKI